MLFFGDLDFVVMGVFDLVLRVLMLVLRNWRLASRTNTAGSRGTHPKHGQVVVALFHRIVDGVDKARIVFSTLRNVVGTRARCGRDVVPHDLRDELGGLFIAILERLVRIRVGFHNQVDVGLERGELGSVMTVPVVGEGSHHLRQLLGKHVAPFVALRRLWLRGCRRMAQRKVVRWRRTAISNHGDR